MKKLCLFTNGFPYGDMEPYLETEIKYYDSFESVSIFSLQLRKAEKKKKKNIPQRFNVVEVNYASRLVYFFNAFVVLFDLNLYKELKYLIKNKRLSFRRVVELFVFLSRSHYEARRIIKNTTREQLQDSVFYSYRFEYQPYVAYLVKKHYRLNVPIISRAHRYDLYENFRATGYIPLRETILELVEFVFPCSLEGKCYIESHASKFSEKIVTKYLGTEDYGVQTGKRDSRIIRIISCSTVRPVKRVELILDALRHFTGHRIEWTHFGDGPLLERIKEKAKELTDNVTVSFPGNISNSLLLEHYKKEYYDMFLNVSTSEGLPVSIMEAMSFGIPCIATDVGGTREIVDNQKNGVLIDEDTTDTKLYEHILSIVNMNEEEYKLLRKSARDKWEQCFSAQTNYKRFVEELLRMSHED